MIIFNTDLDNTLIYSYKHDIGTDKINVEIYNGRENSFVSKKTFRLLNELNEQVMIVPTTTRSIEQYERIDLGINKLRYALVCNGGILLDGGKIDESWYKASLKLIENSKSMMEEAGVLLENEPRRYFEVRYVEELFLFSKCTEPEAVVTNLLRQLDNKQVDVFNNGDKVYVVPKMLNKGNAIKRLREQLNPRMVIAAGDSEFDISMVVTADVGYVPKGFKKKYEVIRETVIEANGRSLFSEELLSMCIEKIAEHK